MRPSRRTHLYKETRIIIRRNCHLLIRHKINEVKLLDSFDYFSNNLNEFGINNYLMLLKSTDDIHLKNFIE